MYFTHSTRIHRSTTETSLVSSPGAPLRSLAGEAFYTFAGALFTEFPPPFFVENFGGSAALTTFAGQLVTTL